MNFILEKALLSLLFNSYNPYFFTTFSKFLSLLFPYFSVDGHLKACLVYLTASNALFSSLYQVFLTGSNLVYLTAPTALFSS